MFMFNMPLSKPRRAFQVKQKPACKATQGNPQYSNATCTYAFCPPTKSLTFCGRHGLQSEREETRTLFSVGFKSEVKFRRIELSDHLK